MRQVLEKWFCRGFCLLWLLLGEAQGGGGPENVLLVVNPSDNDSLTIANHYLEARRIPANNLVMIPWDRTQIEADIETFQQKILQPILAEIEKRKLQKQIDYIIYSAGFPYAISYEKFRKTPPDPKFPQRASLTGLTFLFETVDSGAFETTELINRYVASSLAPEVYPSRGFRARYAFNDRGEQQMDSEGSHYYLSMALGFTSTVAKNRVDEVLRYLEEGVQADGVQPQGTFYFMRNQDVRSKVRHDRFPEAIKLLQSLGKEAVVQEGILPENAHDILGLCIGRAKFDWPSSGNRVMPGAICENFTSFGGVLNGWNDGQSLLLDFLQGGAVASSGTVSEPRAIWQKFPLPMLYVHYAQGCSVAEAFYQSVASPYQLLIVGDPLCQPWAHIPKVNITGLDNSKVLHGRVTCQVTSFSGTGLSGTGLSGTVTPIRRHSIFLDGQLVSELNPREPIQIDTTKLHDGYHELRVVAVSGDPVETQGRHVVPFICHNPDSSTELEGKTEAKSPGVPTVIEQRPLTCRVENKSPILGDKVSIEVSSPGARQIRVYRGRQEMGRVDGDQGKVTVDVSALGTGPISLQAVAIADGKKPLLGIPLKFHVAANPTTPQPQGNN